MQHKQMLNIVLGYAILSAAYILLSDSLLYAIAPDLEALSSISMLKGIGFVAFTSATLFVLLRRIRLDETRRYQALVEQHQAIMLLVHPDSGNILDANKAAADFYGYSLQQLRGMHITALNHQPRENAPAVLARSLRNEQTVFHLQHWLADGQVRDVSVRNGPVTHNGEKVLLSIIQDETDERRSQRELERSNRLLAMLSQCNQALVKSRDRSELFTEVCRIAVEVGGFQFAWIGMTEADGDVVPVARSGEDHGYIDAIKASSRDDNIRGIGPTGVALRRGSAVVSNDFLNDPHTIAWHAAAQASGVRATAAWPIRHDSEFIGSLNLYSGEAGFFGLRELETLDAVIEDLAYGLSHLDNQQALQVTADVVEASPVVLFRWRNAPDWPVLFVTDNVRNWGYSAASLTSGRVPFSQLVHPEDLARIGAEVAAHVASRQTSYEQIYRIVTADQQVRWVDDHTSVSYDAAGTAEFFEGILTDITDKKAAEATIRDYLTRLEQAFLGTTLAVSQLVELRDPYTAGHERRVGALGAAIAAELGYDEHMQRGLQVAGALHDVGKIMVPVEILSKPSRLNESEFSLIRMHPEEGYKVLKDVPFPWPVADVALQHHERLDGSGYPQGLRGDAICLEARIIAVADVVESMSSHRPYRAARGMERALNEIGQGAGTLYDADVVVACLRLFREKGYALEAPVFALDHSMDR